MTGSYQRLHGFVSRKLKILVLIDDLGSGGAQRQAVLLLKGLHCRGHIGEIATYYQRNEFFRGELESRAVRIHDIKKSHRFSMNVPFRYAALFAEGRYDGVIAFLGTPCLYAELASFLVKPARLIVSERSHHSGESSRLRSYLQRLLHLRADAVVANSESQAEWLRGIAGVRDRVVAIYNGVEVGPLQRIEKPRSIGSMRLLVVGRVGPEKNAIELIKALQLLLKRRGEIPRVQWAGRRDDSQRGQAYCDEVDEELERSPDVKARWDWLGERYDVSELLRQSHALVLPSKYEGFPNVICEAFAHGRPVVASDVSDNRRLVGDGLRGRVFRLGDGSQCATAIEQLSGVSDEQWFGLCHSAREYATTVLSVERMVDSYISLVSGR